MAKWINSVDPVQAALTQWNHEGGIRVRYPVEDPNDTASVCFLLLAHPLSDSQRGAFKELLLSDTLSDANRLNRLALLRQILKDVEVLGGCTAPEEIKDIENHSWRFIIDAKLRSDFVPPAAPE